MRLRVLFLLTLFGLPSCLQAQNGATGLSVFVDAGLLVPNGKQANFYDGRDERQNTIYRVLHSESYGREIWQSLKNQGYITDAVGSYSQLQVEEWPDMYYKLTYQIGFGLRYGYDGGWGWLLRFDYARLTAAGAWNISSANGTGVVSDRGRYVRCGMYGLENRILIDIAATKRVELRNNFALEIDAGLNVNNTKVKEQKIEVAGNYYNVLDIWNGNTPYVGIGTYDYVNQGGIGLGTFASLTLAYELRGYGSAELGYTGYFMQTKYKGYNDDDAFALQHVVFVRFNLNNFSFWDN